MKSKLCQHVLPLVLVALLAPVALLSFAPPAGAVETEKGGVPEGRPDPEMLKALERKKREAEALRRRVQELEALLRMKNEISEAKSRAIEQLEKARKNKKKKQAAQ